MGTLGVLSGSSDTNGLGRAEKWISVSPWNWACEQINSGQVNPGRAVQSTRPHVDPGLTAVGYSAQS